MTRERVLTLARKIWDGLLLVLALIITYIVGLVLMVALEVVIYGSIGLMFFAPESPILQTITLIAAGVVFAIVSGMFVLWVWFPEYFPFHNPEYIKVFQQDALGEEYMTTVRVE